MIENLTTIISARNQSCSIQTNLKQFRVEKIIIKIEILIINKNIIFFCTTIAPILCTSEYDLPATFDLVGNGESPSTTNNLYNLEEYRVNRVVSI